MPKTPDFNFEALLNGARSYLQSADRLRGLSPTVGEDRDPIYMLYFHATELALKAFLVFKGRRVSDMKRKEYGHNVASMLSKCLEAGLPIDPADNHISNVIGLLQQGNNNQAFRYFSPVNRSIPDLEWTSETLQRLVKIIGIATGHQTRGTPGRAVKVDLVIRVNDRA